MLRYTKGLQPNPSPMSRRRPLNHLTVFMRYTTDTVTNVVIYVTDLEYLVVWKFHT